MMLQKIKMVLLKALSHTKGLARTLPYTQLTQKDLFLSNGISTTNNQSSRIAPDYTESLLNCKSNDIILTWKIILWTAVPEINE